LSDSAATPPNKFKRFIARTWAFIATPSARFPLGLLVVFGGLLALLGWGAFNLTLHATNTEAFCLSCHEHSITQAEAKQAIHYQNRTGNRATCPDCHVPHELFPKLRVKIVQGFADLYYHFLGSIDTPEKYEKKRLHMAESVWASMKAVDSRECRNCHSVAAMDPKRQSAAAQGAHAALQTGGVTCVDCHRGIAHKLP